jgi:hypothetical protein
MKLLVIGSGRIVKVDDADLAELSKHSWRFDGRYAYRFEGSTKVYMHQILCDAALVDHDNRDKLDNQRHNLKPSNQFLNQHNRKTRCKGVSFNQNAKKWEAYITLNGKRSHLGLFDTEAQAISVRESAT